MFTFVYNVDSRSKGLTMFLFTDETACLVCLPFVSFVNKQRGRISSGGSNERMREISFRVTEKLWLDIERATANDGIQRTTGADRRTPETIRTPEEMRPNSPLLLSQICHTVTLVWIGFQLLESEDCMFQRTPPNKLSLLSQGRSWLKFDRYIGYD
jgi:hypothetical protein